MIRIALCRTEHPGNLGATARAMANFGFSELLLLDACAIDEESRRLAKHASAVLENARGASWKELQGYGLLVGTTAQLGTDYNLPRSPLLPAELAEKLRAVSGDVILVFGPEGEGLSNEELRRCDIVVRIPTSEKYPTMNLSHAVAVLCYALSQSDIRARFPLAGRRETEVALSLIDDIVPRLGFTRGLKEETHRRLWRRMLGKAMLTRREMAALLGFLRLAARRLSRAAASSAGPSARGSRRPSARPAPRSSRRAPG